MIFYDDKQQLIEVNDSLVFLDSRNDRWVVVHPEGRNDYPE